MAMRQWYAVYCKPKEDERAETHLARQSFEVFRPKHWVQRKRAGVMTPVFVVIDGRVAFALRRLNAQRSPKSLQKSGEDRASAHPQIPTFDGAGLSIYSP